MVKKLILFGLFLYSTLFLSGCQLLSDFVIVNDSSDYIEIIYEVKDPGYKSLTPLYITSKEFNNNEDNWQTVPQERYETVDTGTVKVKLAPNEVLRIEYVNVNRFEKNPDKEFNTKSLRITDKNSSIYLEGKQVLEQFKPEDRSWALISSPTYVFRYGEK